MRRRARVTLALHIVAMLALLKWQLSKFFRLPLASLRQLDFARGKSVWPLQVAAIAFSAQFLICFWAWTFVFLLGKYRQGWAPAKEFLDRYGQMSATMAVIALICACYYQRLALEDSVRVSIKSWSPGHMETRIVGRYFIWTMLAPFEWLPYFHLYTRASTPDIILAMVLTADVMLLGAASILDDCQTTKAGESAALFVASCLAMAYLFKHASEVGTEPGMERAKRRCLYTFGVVWLIYPLLHLLRYVGLVSPWADQVLLTSLLDVIAKSVLLVSLCSAPLVVLLMSALANLQMVGAAYDLSFTVMGDNWRVCRGTGALTGELALRSHLLGSDWNGSSFLDRVAHEDQRLGLVRAASIMDGQNTVKAQKVAVELLLADGHVSKTECVISRSFLGRRQIGLNIWRTISPDALEEAPRMASLPLSAATPHFSDGGTPGVSSEDQSEAMDRSIPLYRIS